MSMIPHAMAPRRQGGGGGGGAVIRILAALAASCVEPWAEAGFDVSEPGCALPMEDKPTKWMSVSKAECAALPRCTWRPTVRVASGQCVEREQATCGELQVRQQLLNYGPDFCVLSQTNFSSKSCAPSMSRPDAARHCRALGMRLCHVAEQVALSSQNYGCGLSGEILWANDYCPKLNSFYHSKGSSRFADEQPLCRDASKSPQGYVRCCAGTATSTVTTTSTTTVGPLTIEREAADVEVESDGAGSIAALHAWLDAAGHATASPCPNVDGPVQWTATPASEPKEDQACAHGITQLYTFQARDACGQTAHTSASFTVVDAAPPVLTSPVLPLTLDGTECSSFASIDACETAATAQLAAWLDSNGGAAAQDAASRDRISWTQTPVIFEQRYPASSCRDTVAEVTFTVTDECANAASTSATVMWTRPGPSFTVTPEDRTVQLDGNSAVLTVAFSDWVDAHGGAQAVDRSTSLQIVNWAYAAEPSTPLDSACTDAVTVVNFTATDSCGRSASESAQFFMVDTTPPYFTEVARSGQGAERVQLQQWLQSHAGAQALDLGTAANQIAWTHAATESAYPYGPAGCHEFITTAVFTATDLCGNQAATTATFILRDSSGPVVEEAPASITLELGSPVAKVAAWTEISGHSVATDSLNGPVSWSFRVIDQIPDSDAALGCKANETVYEFLATDRCGIATAATASVHHVDTLPPTVTTPAKDIVVEADGDGNKLQLDTWLAAAGGASASDLSGVKEWRYREVSTKETKDGPFVVAIETTYEFKAVDGCGNQIITATTAAFVIVDTVPPALVEHPLPLVVVEADGHGNVADFEGWLASAAGMVVSDVGFDRKSCGVRRNRRADNNPCFCSDLYQPVCADGTFEFQNACYAYCAGIFSFVFLPCPTGADDPLLSTTAKSTPGPLEPLAPPTRPPTEPPSQQPSAARTVPTAHPTSIPTKLPSAAPSQPSTTVPSPEPNLLTTQTSVAADVEPAGGSPTVAAESDSCRDVRPSGVCNAWKLLGYCAQYSPYFDYMLVGCAQTCSLCSFEGRIDSAESTVGDDSNSVSTRAASSTVFSSTASKSGCLVPPLDMFSVQNNTKLKQMKRNILAVLQTVSLEACAEACVDFDSDTGAYQCKAFEVKYGKECTLKSVSAADVGRVENDKYGLYERFIFGCGEEVDRSTDGQSTSPTAMMPSGAQTDDATTPATAATSRTACTSDKCAATYSPVCSEAGASFQSSCHAECAGVRGYTHGACTSCGHISWSNSAPEFQSLSTGTGSTPAVCLNGDLRVNFTAVDVSGNKFSSSASFRIRDTSPPILTRAPHNQTIELESSMLAHGAANELDLNVVSQDANLQHWLHAAGYAQFADAQADDLVIHHSPEQLQFRPLVPSQPGCISTRVDVKFHVADPCGNVASTVLGTFSFADHSAPVLLREAEQATFEVGQSGTRAHIVQWAAAHGGALVQDVSTITWVNDITPNLDVGRVGWVECRQHSELVTFIASDACGNSITSRATLQLADTIPPTLTSSAANLTVVLDTQDTTPDKDREQVQQWLRSHGGASIAVESGGAVTWTHDEVLFRRFNDKVPAILCPNRRADVTFRATDECGNAVESKASLTLEAGAPRFTAHARNVTVETDGEGNQKDLQAWLKLRGYSEISVPEKALSIRDTVWTHSVIGRGLGFNLSVSRPSDRSVDVKFTAEDGCSSVLDTVATFSIADTQAPTITTPAQDLSIQTTSDEEAVVAQWLRIHGGSVAHDHSGIIKWTADTTAGYRQLRPSDHGCQDRALTVTFSVYDPNGNRASTTATFTSQDTAAPVLVKQPEHITVEDDGKGNAADLTSWIEQHGHAQVLDDSTNSTWSSLPEAAGLTWHYSFDAEMACSRRYAEVQFAATDQCGNKVMTNAARFTIEDTLAPQFTVLAQDVVFDVDEAGAIAQVTQWLETHGGADATDASGSITWSHNVSLELLLNPEHNFCQPQIFVVHFKARDECGLVATTTALLTLVDKSPPRFQKYPQNESVPSIDGGLAGIDLGKLSVAQLANVNADRLRNWIESVGYAEIDTTRAEALVWSTSPHSPAPASQPEDDCIESEIGLTFTVTDACGWSSHQEARFQVAKLQKPKLAMPAQSATHQMEEADEAFQEWLDAHAYAATEAQFDTTWMNRDFDFWYPTSLCKTRTARVIFDAVDSCGNSVSTEANFTMIDASKPTFTRAAESITFETPRAPGSADDHAEQLPLHSTRACSELSSQWKVRNVTTGSPGVCGESDAHPIGDCVSRVHHEVAAATCFSYGLRLCTSKELLANVGRGTGCQLDKKPVWASESCIQDNGDVGWNTVRATTSDVVCQDPSWTLGSMRCCADEAPIKFIAPDINAPEAAGVWLQAHGNAEVHESERDTVAWAHTEPRLERRRPWSSCDDADGQVTFTATNNCGNAASVHAFISITDTVAPTFVVAPQDISVSADGLGNVEELSAFIDARGGAETTESVSWTHTEVESGFGQGFRFDPCSADTAVIRFSAIDGCGNAAHSDASFTIVDDTPPALVALAQDITVEAMQQPNSANLYDAAILQTWLQSNGGAVATDTISSTLTWTYIMSEPEPVISGSGKICFASTRRQVVFTVSDECGNTAETRANFIVLDTTPPRVGCAHDLVQRCDRRCGSNMGFKSWLTRDEGGLCISDVSPYDVTHNFPHLREHGWFQNSVCGSNGAVIFRIEDECGNVATQTLQYDVADDTPACRLCEDGTETATSVTLAWRQGNETALQDTLTGAEAFFRTALLSSSTIVSYAPVAVNCAIFPNKGRCEKTNPAKAGCVWDPKVSPSCVHKEAVFTTVALGEGDQIAVDLKPEDSGVIVSAGGGKWAFVWTLCAASIPGRVRWAQPTAETIRASLRDKVYIGSRTDGLGQLEVTGFERADGTASDSCSDTPPCEQNVCHNTNVCSEGPGSVRSVRVMYLGWNPDNLHSGEYTQTRKAVKISSPGPEGLSPAPIFLHKYQGDLVTDPATNLQSVVIGQEITVNSAVTSASDGKLWMPQSMNFRIDPTRARHQARFDLKCFAKNRINVGDRFGPMLVTGFVAEEGTKCHLHFTPQELLNEQQRSAVGLGAGIISEQEDVDTTDKDGARALGILVGGLALLAIVTGIVAHTMRSRRLQESETFSETSSYRSAGQDSRVSIDVGRRVLSAFDLMTDHYGTDASESIGQDAAGEFSPGAAFERELQGGLDWDSTGGTTALSPPRMALSPKELARHYAET